MRCILSGCATPGTYYTYVTPGRILYLEVSWQDATANGRRKRVVRGCIEECIDRVYYTRSYIVPSGIVARCHSEWASKEGSERMY